MTILAAAKQTLTVVKTIFSIPDYDKYLMHRQRCHPGEAVMSEKEFYLHTLKERYESGKVNRCC